MARADVLNKLESLFSYYESLNIPPQLGYPGVVQASKDFATMTAILTVQEELGYNMTKERKRYLQLRARLNQWLGESS